MKTALNSEQDNKGLTALESKAQNDGLGRSNHFVTHKHHCNGAKGVCSGLAIHMILLKHVAISMFKKYLNGIPQGNWLGNGLMERFQTSTPSFCNIFFA